MTRKILFLGITPIKSFFEQGFMSSDEKRKRLERQARSLLISKDISAAEREQVNSIMKNQNLSPEERFESIIKLMGNAPDREFDEIPDIEIPEQNSTKEENNSPMSGKPETAKVSAPPVIETLPGKENRVPQINGPTETSLYINDINLKYKAHKIFKKRYLVERNNRFGFGLRKRLIPTKKYLEIMRHIQSFQETVLSRIPFILDYILKSNEIDTPLEFNYLRALRKWLLDMPFASIPYSRIKWLEQWGFERELKSYAVNFFSFMRMEQKHRERLIQLTESIIRDAPDLLKEEIINGEERSSAVKKEKNNFYREKMIYEYMGALRSFIAVPGEPDSSAARHLVKKFGINSLADFLHMSIEALIFQRPYTPAELREYFEIGPVAVSKERWNYNQEKLKEYGKDPESIRLRALGKLKSELLWYDTVFQLVKIEDNGQNILIKSADEQWKLMDKINRDAEDSLQKNFIVFLEGVVNYFRNILVPLLNGSILNLESPAGPVEGVLFPEGLFEEELREIEELNNEIYLFRNQNPTLKISFEEIEKIISRKISSMTHVEKVLYKAGRCFYFTGRRLHQEYHNHLKAISSAFHNHDKNEEKSKKLIPFHNCRLKGFEEKNPLLRRIEGRRIISESQKGGIIIFMIAYCYQASNICGYREIKNDISKRDSIKRQIKGLQGGTK
jgi:hypothetical protein